MAFLGAAVVKLPAIGQLQVAFKKEEVRCAGSIIGTSNFLRFIIQIGKGKPDQLSLLYKACGRIVRIICCIVAADSDDSNPLFLRNRCQVSPTLSPGALQTDNDDR